SILCIPQPSTFSSASSTPSPPPKSTPFPYTTLFRSHVSVFVREMQSHPVSVLGAVRKPGVFQVRGSKTLLEILSLAEESQARSRSEEHTSELQSPDHIVCRLLLEKKKKIIKCRQKLD